MNASPLKNVVSSVKPLGAGDLIDRAVRFYRGNFLTFIWIAAPPVIVGTVISVAWTLLGRQLFSVGSARGNEELVGYYLFTWFGGVLILLTEIVGAITVMGGASRNFVRHLLFGEPVTFRETYKNTGRRIGGLIGASTLITFLLGIIGFVLFYFGLIVGAIAVFVAVAALSFSPFLSSAAALVFSLAAIGGTLWLFFLIASRFAYVPQIMLVEGLGVFSAVGRSASLASGNVKRLGALFVFTTAATYSALALLYIPLGWYAWVSGIDLFSFNADTLPAWYEISAQFLWQASLILLMPIWMIGLCLLYVDERVRHEGYDIELMAAARLGEIPNVPQEFLNPLQPALANRQPPVAAARKDSTTTLGLQ